MFQLKVIFYQQEWLWNFICV